MGADVFKPLVENGRVASAFIGGAHSGAYKRTTAGSHERGTSALADTVGEVRAF